MANLTADIGRGTSMALAQALLPYLLKISRDGLEGALGSTPELARGVYTHGGVCVRPGLAEALGVAAQPLSELLAAAAEGRS